MVDLSKHEEDETVSNLSDKSRETSLRAHRDSLLLRDARLLLRELLRGLILLLRPLLSLLELSLGVVSLALYDILGFGSLLLCVLLRLLVLLLDLGLDLDLPLRRSVLGVSLDSLGGGLVGDSLE